MSLLQIIDLEDTAPLQAAIGIDLGTTHSLVAMASDGEVRYFQQDASDLIPSVVHYDDNNHIMVGKKAQDYLTTHPQQTLYSIKRLMGRRLDEIQAENIHFPFDFVANPEALPKIQVHGNIKTPVDVSADILMALKQLATTEIGPVQQAVITVPAYFDETQRQATIEAARLAHLKVLRLLNEPTSAAIAYGLDKQTSGYCLVYDLGGGTFDVSLLRLEKGVFEVVAIDGIAHLGGDDCDQILIEHLKQIYKLDCTQSTLRLAAKSIKERLSVETTVTTTIAGVAIEVTRSQYEHWIKPLVDQTLQTVHQVLKMASITADAIDHVLMVGGASRTPIIRQQLAALFPNKIRFHLDPDKVVAMGAAIQASILSGHATHGHVLLDVVPLSLGIETMGGIVEKILLRNSKIPCQQTETYTTYEDNQTAISLHVVQGERELASDCRSLARFDLTGIPPMPKGLARIEVCFQMDADGLLQVSACELKSQTKAQITVKPSFELTTQTIGDMIETAIDHANADVRAKKLAQKCVEAQHLKNTVEQAYLQSKELLTEEEAQSLEQYIRALEDAIAKRDSIKSINQTIERLEEEAELLMQKRLQWALDETLAGKSVTEVAKQYD